MAKVEEEKANDPATVAARKQKEKADKDAAKLARKKSRRRSKGVDASQNKDAVAMAQEEAAAKAATGPTPAAEGAPELVRSSEGVLDSLAAVSRATGTSYDAGGTEVVPSRNHLANDNSRTAAQSAMHRENMRRQALKDMQAWIDAVIGDYTEGETLYEVRVAMGSEEEVGTRRRSQMMRKEQKCFSP